MEDLVIFFTTFFKILLLLFAYLPFELHTNGLLLVSRRSCFYSLLFLTLLDYFIYLRIIQMSEYRLERSFLSKISFLSGTLMSRGLTMASIIINIFRRKRLEKVIKLLYSFDQEVNY